METTRGTLTAGQVVVATHYPVLDRGLYFARLKAERSYCVAARVRGSLPQGMSITAGSPTRSVRSYGDLLIVGGEGHATGAREAVPERYERLEQFAREHWDVESVAHRWSSQDPVPYDHLPVIGRYTPFTSTLFVASGFMKWGLATGTFAAIILSDLIAGRVNPSASRVDLGRLSLVRRPSWRAPTRRSARSFRRPPAAGRRLDRHDPAGKGRVVRDGLGKKGVYRDEQGELHAVSLRCTHLGCLAVQRG